ncbi:MULTISPECIES: TRAP transporter substrate-binding protein [unclassified Chelatococcus]|uniref:TRAP transporter substrate-binding protein n=1 Tax=unclassified Chelatococcus TaxID=2638111 RepID=UPI001BCDB214|nr:MULTISPECIES: TRAP transporter substrate-binding protein [unclassified Chelatococcus]MBS7700350.1 TRAP transporter substrate-binding protein [Chelatococcus sp. YT9]MBX3556146.1 TRAP transporter substrate-binding protein [Chelatococcus sp.]
MIRGAASAVLGVLFSLFLSGAVLAQPIELKVTHYLPPNHQLHKKLEEWGEDLAKRSDGRLKLTIFPAAQMGPMPRQYDLARTGVADIAFFLHGALPGRFPLTELTQLPYVFNRGEGAAAKAISTAEASAIVTEMAADLAAEHEGTKLLYFIATPTVSLFSNKGAVRDPTAMRGMRIRHNGPIASAIIEAWGGSPAAVTPAELADALAKGTIGGMLFNYEAAKSFQMAESIKSVTPVKASAGTFALVMNAERYKSLPEDLRKLIDETTGPEAARRIGALYDAAEDEGEAYLRAAKVEILDLTPAERAAFEEKTSPITASFLAKAEAKNVKARDFYDRLRAAVGRAQ